MWLTLGGYKLTDDGKWRRAPLKSRWYDDHFGQNALETVENRIRHLDDRLLKDDEEQVASREVERFFDLFDEPQKG